MNQPPAPASPCARAPLSPSVRPRCEGFQPLALLLPGLLLLSGCTTAESVTYFGAANVDAANPTVNLYRVRVKTKSTNSKSSLMTGFYDTTALRSLYGEVSPTAVVAAPDASAGLGTYNVVFRDGRWQLVDPKHLYTVVFGPDAKAISGLIKTYAESATTGAQFGSLLAAATNPEAVKISGQVQAQENALKEKKKALAGELLAQANSLTPAGNATKSTNDVLAELIKAAQTISNNLGSTTTFSLTDPDASLTAVRTFLQTERNRTP